MPIRLVEVDQETYEEAKETYLDLREAVEEFEESGETDVLSPHIDPDLIHKALDILDQLMLSYENSFEEEEEVDESNEAPS